MILNFLLAFVEKMLKKMYNKDILINKWINENCVPIIDIQNYKQLLTIKLKLMIILDFLNQNNLLKICYLKKKGLKIVILEITFKNENLFKFY
jgi:hypothetical protein